MLPFAASTLADRIIVTRKASTRIATGPASSNVGTAPARRGRPPRKVYINVLVKATTREALTRLKASGDFASQGEVIDALVAQTTELRSRS